MSNSSPLYDALVEFSAGNPLAVLSHDQGNLTLPVTTAGYRSARGTLLGALHDTSAYAAMPEGGFSQSAEEKMVDDFVAAISSLKARFLDSCAAATGLGSPPARRSASGAGGGRAADGDDGADDDEAPPSNTRLQAQKERDRLRALELASVVDRQLHQRPDPTELPTDYDSVSSYKCFFEASRRLIPDPEQLSLKLGAGGAVPPSKKVFKHDRGLSFDDEFDLAERYYTVLAHGGAVIITADMNIELTDYDEGSGLFDADGVALYVFAQFNLIKLVLVTALRREARMAGLKTGKEAAAFLDKVRAHMNESLYISRASLTTAARLVMKANLARTCAHLPGSRGSFSGAGPSGARRSKKAKRPPSPSGSSSSGSPPRRKQGKAKAKTAKHSHICFKWADHDLGFSSRKCPYTAADCRWAHKWPDGAAKRAYEKKNKEKRRRADSDSD